MTIGEEGLTLLCMGPANLLNYMTMLSDWTSKWIVWPLLVSLTILQGLFGGYRDKNIHVLGVSVMMGHLVPRVFGVPFFFFFMGFTNSVQVELSFWP